VLSATSTRRFLDSSLTSTIFLERRLRAHLVVRDRLLFDTRYAPPARKARPFVHVYASLTGVLHADDAPPRDGPQVYVLAEHEFDRVTAVAPTFRSWGAPCTIVELRVHASDVRRPIGLGRGPLAISDAAWRAYAAFADRPAPRTLTALLDALGASEVVDPALATSIVDDEPDRFARIWDVLRPLYEDLATSTSLKQVAVLAGLSLRQLGRDLGDFTRTFGLYGNGFREAMRVVRLRAACLLLSAPGASPSEVARTVGYGSLDAMGRAFRDAHLPAPSTVQAAVAYESLGTIT
jgi:AraC-like DNA-binding protein